MDDQQHRAGHSPPCHAVLDVGGTSIKVGAVLGTAVATRPSVPARARADAATVLGQLRLAADSARECAVELGEGRPDGLVIAFPGPFDFEHDRAMIRGHGKFDAIYGIDLRVQLSSVMASRVDPIADLVFVRDSEAVAVGEARFGAGHGARRVLTCALGTGFGSCLTVDGRPLDAVGSQVIESLHQLDTPDGRADDVLSATGLARLLDVAPEDLAGALGAEQIAPETTEFARRLGRFLAALPFAVDRIVIAGGLAGSFDRLAPGLTAEIDTSIVAARLGATGALLGAAELAFPSDP